MTSLVVVEVAWSIALGEADLGTVVYTLLMDKSW